MSTYDYHFYYDRDGNPIPLERWVELRGIDNHSSIGLDLIGDLTVSTVWLGLNHNFQPGTPLIFETVVFGEDQSTLVNRYSTLTEAEEGHRGTVARLREAAS